MSDDFIRSLDSYVAVSLRGVFCLYETTRAGDQEFDVDIRMCSPESEVTNS